MGHNFTPACRYCHQVENPVSSTDSTLHIPLLPTDYLVLQNLVNNCFNFSAGKKKCSNQTCLNQPQQTFHEIPEFSEQTLRTSCY